MKLGTIKDIKIGKVRAWGYDIKSIWLCKNLSSGTYVVMGLCWDGERAHGWCTLKSTESLKEARAYANSL